MPRRKKTSNLRRWWFGYAFPAALAMFPPLMWCHPKKTINLWHCWLSSFDATSKKNKQPAVLVVFLCVSSSIGDVASSNAACRQNNNQPVALLASLQCHIQKK